MATKVEFRKAHLCDLHYFADLREDDAREVAASGYSPMRAILDSWSYSCESWTVWFDGQPACVFGVTHHPGATELAPVGVVWLLTTPVVEQHPVVFFRCSKQIVKLLNKRYGALVNYIDARYDRALRWAARIGFAVHPAVPFGNHGEPFHPITFGG